MLGYGDIVPQTTIGKMFCAIGMIVGVAYLAKLANSLANYLMLLKRVKHETNIMDRLLVTDDQVSLFV